YRTDVHLSHAVDVAANSAPGRVHRLRARSTLGICLGRAAAMDCALAVARHRWTSRARDGFGSDPAYVLEGGLDVGVDAPHRGGGVGQYGGSSTDRTASRSRPAEYR